MAVRAWFGGVLVAVGVLWLLDAAAVIDAGAVTATWWPLALIALALAAVTAQRGLSPGPVVVFVVGLGLLVENLVVVQLSAFLWPLAAIAIGVLLLVRFARGTRDASYGTGSTFSLLGGAQTSDRSEHFQRASVTAVLGGATLDLSEAHVEEDARVDAFALFGGVDVVVPDGCRVQLAGLPVFGGYEDKTRGHGPLVPDAPVVHVNATAIFGGVEVEHASQLADHPAR